MKTTTNKKIGESLSQKQAKIFIKMGGSALPPLTPPCSCSPAIAGLGKIKDELLMCKIILLNNFATMWRLFGELLANKNSQSLPMLAICKRFGGS